MGAVESRCCSTESEQAEDDGKADVANVGSESIFDLGKVDVALAKIGPIEKNTEEEYKNGDIVGSTLSEEPELMPLVRRKDRKKTIRNRPGSKPALIVDKSPEEKQMIVQVLLANYNLHRLVPLGEKYATQLAAIAWSKVLEKGDVLFHAGDDDCDAFYVAGDCRLEISSCVFFETVTKNGISHIIRPPGAQNIPIESPKSSTTRHVQVVSGRACLGEFGVLYRAPRFATVTALESSKVWCIDQESLKRVLRSAVEDYVKKHANDTSKESPLGMLRQGLTPYSLQVEFPKDVMFLSEVLRLNRYLAAQAPLQNEHILLLLDAARPLIFEKGQALTTEGDHIADTFFIVEHGSVELRSHDAFELDVEPFTGIMSIRQIETFQNDDQETVHTARKGTCIGLRSMLFGTPRSQTATALERSVVWAIDRFSFKTVQIIAAEDLMKQRVKYLDKMEVLNELSAHDKETIAKCLEEVCFVEFELVLQQGELGSTFYVLIDGSVQVLIDGKKVAELTADPSAGVVQYFGESALLTNQPRSATVQVTSSSADGFVLEREDFMMLAEVLEKNRRGSKEPNGAQNALDAKRTAGPKGVKARATKRRRTFVETLHRASFHEERGRRNSCLNDPLSLAHLTPLGILEMSDLGQMVHCKDLRSGNFYSLKKFEKGLIVSKGFQQSVMNEKKIWLAVTSPFVLNCYGFFNDPRYLCICLEATLGGPLSYIFPKQNFWGRELPTKYYIAATAHGLHHIHQRRVVLRNLKPSNMLVNEMGRLKLSDMSLAKIVIGKTYTTCGTPDYMAPEILIGSGHSKGVDWYALGIVTFELMAGHPPFEADHPMEVYSNTMRGIDRVAFPEALQGVVVSFIKSMAKPRPVDRLAMRLGGYQNISKHKWYHDFAWDALGLNRMSPPYVPSPDEAPQVAELEETQPTEYNDDGSGWDAGWSDHEGSPQNMPPRQISAPDYEGEKQSMPPRQVSAP